MSDFKLVSVLGQPVLQVVVSGPVFSAGTNSQVTGTINFANSNGVTWGLDTNGTMTASIGGIPSPVNFSAGTTSGDYGAIVFSNSNGVSFGLSAGTITASANAGGGGGGAALQGSGTYTQNTGTVQFANSNGITFGLSNNGTMTASHNGLTQQSTQPVAYSAANGSANFSTITFANSNGVSFSTGTQGIYATVKTDYQTAGAYLTTARASNDAIGLNTALTGNGVLVTANSAGLSINVPAFLTTAMQSQSSSNFAGVGSAITNGLMTFNTAGLSLNLSNHLTTAMQTGSQSQLWIMGNSSGTVGGTNISGTVYSNGMSLSVAAPGGGGGAAISAGANSQNTGTVNFSNANGVTFGLSNNGVMTASVAAAGGAQTGISGISAGTQMQTAGTMQFLDSNGITWGMANSSQITATVKTDYQSSNANYLTSQSNQAVSAGTQASSTFQTLSFANSNGVSWSTGTQGLYATVVTSYQPAGAYLTTAMQTGSQSQLWVMGNSSATVGGTNISGTMYSNGLSLSAAAPGGGGNTMTVSAANGSFQSNAITFANSNGVSFSTGTQGVYATVVTSYQPAGAYLTTARASNDAIGLNSALTAGGVNASVSMTANSSGLSLNFPAFLTTAGLSGDTTKYAGVGSAITNGLMTFNTAGLSLNLSAHLTTAAQSSVSNVSAIYAATNNTGGGTATLSGGVSFSNANSVTFYTSAGNAIAISLPAYLTTAMQTGSQSQLWIMGNSSAAVGGTNISGTMYSNGLSLSVAAGGGGADGGNTLAVAGSTAGSNSLVLFSNSPTVTFGMAGNTITASAAGGGGGAVYTAKWFQPELYGATTTIQHNAGNLILRPFEINDPIDFDQLVLQQSFVSSLSTYRMSGSISAGNASSGTATWGQTITALLFSRVNTDEANASYNSIISFMSETAYVSAGYSASCSWTTNVSSATCSWTTSGAVGFLKNIDQTGGVTYGSTATSGSSTFSSTSTNANSFSSSYAMSFPYAHLSGVRPFIVQGDGANLSAGEYWLGIRQSTQTGSTNFSMQQVAMMGTSPGLMIFTASANSYLEYGNSAAINSSNWRLGFGSITGGTLTTTQLALSQFSSAGSNASLYFAINGYTK